MSRFADEEMFTFSFVSDVIKRVEEFSFLCFINIAQTVHPEQSEYR